MGYVVIGIVTAVNMIVVLMKVKRGRYEDAIFDVSLLTVVAILFSGSYGGMVVSMIASMIISIYLFANPPAFFGAFLRRDEVKIATRILKTKVNEGMVDIKNKLTEMEKESLRKQAEKLKQEGDIHL